MAADDDDESKSEDAEKRVPLGALVAISRVVSWVIDVRLAELRTDLERMQAQISELADRIEQQGCRPAEAGNSPAQGYMRHEVGPRPSADQFSDAVRRLEEGIEPPLVAEDLGMTEAELLSELAKLAGTR